MKAISTDYASPSFPLTITSEGENAKRLLAVNLSKTNSAPFLPVSLAAFGRDALITSPDLETINPHEALAIGVLSEAAHDLRRFHTAMTGIERELYLDAYSWFIANDFSWPYSFVNVCEVLGASPDTVRAELLADVSLGWYGHWIKLTARTARLLRASFIRCFKRPRNTSGAEAASSEYAF